MEGRRSAPKLASGAGIKKLDPSEYGTPVGPQTPAGKSLKKTFAKMTAADLDPVDPSKPEAGRTRRNKSGETELKNMAASIGFKNPNGVLQFMNRVLEKFKSRYENIEDVQVATLEIMKEYIDELSSPYKQSGKVTTEPVITPQDAELLRQHPEMIEDLDTFRVYLNKKLKERGL